jgi:hypothetical protein
MIRAIGPRDRRLHVAPDDPGRRRNAAFFAEFA